MVVGLPAQHGLGLEHFRLSRFRQALAGFGGINAVCLRIAGFRKVKNCFEIVFTGFITVP